MCVCPLSLLFSVLYQIFRTWSLSPTPRREGCQRRGPGSSSRPGLSGLGQSASLDLSFLVPATVFLVAS